MNLKCQCLKWNLYSNKVLTNFEDGENITHLYPANSGLMGYILLTVGLDHFPLLPFLHRYYICSLSIIQYHLDLKDLWKYLLSDLWFHGSYFRILACGLSASSPSQSWVRFPAYSRFHILINHDPLHHFLVATNTKHSLRFWAVSIVPLNVYPMLTAQSPIFFCLLTLLFVLIFFAKSKLKGGFLNGMQNKVCLTTCGQVPLKGLFE